MATIIKIVYDVTTPVIKVTYDVTNITIGGAEIAPVYISLDYSSSSAVSVITSVALTMPTGFSVANSPLTQSGTLAVTYTPGYSLPTTTKQSEWDQAYNDKINSAIVTGTSTKTLTLNQQDGGTIQTSWSDLNVGTVTSVDMTVPNGLAISGNPITSAGTLALALASGYTIPTQALLDGKVPYIGATGNVDLGEFELKAGQIEFDQTPTGTIDVGVMRWNDTDGTVDLRLKGNNVTLQVGQEQVVRIVNKTGASLLEADYKVVRIRSVSEGGAQGQRLAVVLAQGDTAAHSKGVLGLVTETIPNNQEGFITIIGQVHEINTTGSLQGETWVDGDKIYLSATTAGNLTNVAPIAPNHAVVVGYVEYSHSVHGKIFVEVNEGLSLDELHNVYAPSPTSNQSIWWNASTLRYENNTIAGVLGYTPVTSARTLTINGTTYDLSANRTWNVGTVTTAAAIGGGQVMFSNGGTVITSVSGLYFDGVNKLGIGNSSPAYNLDVTGTARMTGNLTAASFIKSGGTSSQFLKADGSVDSSVYYLASNPSVYIALTALSASAPLSYNNGTGAFTISQSTGSTNGYLSSTDWNTFNNKQAAGNYITSLTGEVTATGPGAAAATLLNSAVIGKVLTGLNLTGGGTILATDSILQAFGKTQNQISALVGGVMFEGVWNASTNSPTITSSVGSKGDYYVVNVAGSTNVDGITDWKVGDWIIFNGTTWDKVDNTDAVSSVNGFVGAVSLTTANISEVTNLYFTDARARAAISLTTTGSSGASTYVGGVINVPTYSLSGLGGVPTSRTLTINGTPYDLSADRSWSVGTVTSVAALTLGTTGTDLSSSVASGTTTPVITLNVPTASATNRGALSSADWTTFNNKVGTSRTINTTAPLYGGGNLSADRTLTITQAGVASDGYLSAGEWAIFNAKVASVSATSPLLSSGGQNPTITIQQASGSQAGYLSAADWTTFNNKQNAITLTTTGTSGAATLVGATLNIPQYADQFVGTVTSVGLSSATSGVTIGSSPITTSGTITLTIATASGSQQGLLSSTDWTTFNNKQNALTNPVTGTGTTNYLPKWTSGSGLGNSLIYDNGTNVGIGTTSPSALLHLNSSGITNFYIQSGAGNGAVMRYFTGTSEAATTRVDSNGNYTIETGLGSPTERMRITSGGRLLLGTATEGTYLLDVNGTGRFSGFSNSVIDTLTLLNSSQTSSGVRQRFQNGYGDLGAIKVSQIDNGALANDGKLEFQVASDTVLDTKLTILNTGAATFSSTLGINGVADNVKSGIYTPTLTNTFNVASSSLISASYQRIGNTVTVFVKFNMTATLNSLPSTVSISIPMGGNFSATNQANGLCVVGNAAQGGGRIMATTGGFTTVECEIAGFTINQLEINASFQYQVQ